MRDQVADLSAPAPPVGQALSDRAPRYSRILPVRYGVTKPVMFGRTGDLSTSGMFVHTKLPLATGGTAGMLLELEHCRLPLRGTVIWTRSQAGPSRPVGMGVQLVRPPEIYSSYVHALALEPDEPELVLGP